MSAVVEGDGRFTARLQAGTHVPDVGGLPVGYTVRSVRLRGTNVSRGLAAGDADVDDVVIELVARQD